MVQGGRVHGFSRLGCALATLTFSAHRASAKPRAQDKVLGQERLSSRQVHAFLSDLAMPASELRARARAAAELARLSELSRGDLAGVPGMRESLAACLRELDDVRFFAFFSGALGNADARKSILCRVDAGLRAQAARLLDEMAAVLRQGLIRDVLPERLAQISRLPPALPEDARKLEALLIIMRSRRLDDVKEALTSISNHSERKRALDVLSRLHQLLEREVDKLFEPSLTQVELALLTAVNAGEPFHASQALRALDVQVRRTEQACGALSKELAESVSNLVRNSLDVFRDPECNPAGPLSEASLRRLDVDTLENLRRASSLHRLGLNLEAVADTALTPAPTG